MGEFPRAPTARELQRPRPHGASSGFAFCHADRSPYGYSASPYAADAAAKVFAALTHAGCKETEARRALTDATAHVGSDAGFETLLRAAFGQLGRRTLPVSEARRESHEG